MRGARPVAPGMRLMVHSPLRMAHGFGPLLLDIMDGACGRADRNVGNVRTPHTLKEAGLHDGGKRFIVLEISRRPAATGIYHSHRDTLMVKVAALLATANIFEGCGITRPDPQQMRGVGDGNALLHGQDGPVTVGYLMPFSAIKYYFFISVLHRYALAGSAVCHAVGHAFPHRTSLPVLACLLL
jgi:hypothetical protein